MTGKGLCETCLFQCRDVIKALICDKYIDRKQSTYIYYYDKRDDVPSPGKE